MVHSHTDGKMHVTNDKTWFVKSRKLKGHIIDDHGNKIAVERVGQVYLQLESGLYIHLKEVLLCPTSECNLVSRDLISEDVTLGQRGNEFSLTIAPEQPNERIVQIDFSKKFDQKNVILTKQPSFEILIEHATTHQNAKLSSSSENLLVSLLNASLVVKSHQDQFEILSPFSPDSISNLLLNQEVKWRKQRKSLKKARLLLNQEVKWREQRKSLKKTRLLLNQEVKLRTAEQPWKPEFLGKRSEAKPVDKKARLLLNKLTPTNAETITQDFLQLLISSAEKSKVIVEILFQKAISEPMYVGEYALLISELREITVQNAPDQRTIKFLALMLEACQSFFETQQSELEVFDRRREEIHKLDDEERKRQMLDDLDDEILLVRKKGLGNIKLIGALFSHDFLKAEIVELCIDVLLEAGDDVSLEYLCALLKSTGKTFEASPKFKKKFDSKMTTLSDITKGKVRPRTKFLILDVLECRANGWTLREFEEKQKPFKIARLIDQVEVEVEVWFEIF